MSPMDWSRIKELFGSAIELDPKERGAYLRGACGPDEALRAELESLLASYEAQKTAPGRPIADHGYDGRRIGPYQVIDRIGAGGMGAVYLAARADDSFDKRVAIKVVHSASGTEEILQRFRYERQILATLDHPNIAKLLDGGGTEDGLPYFVMEYLERVPIGEYCLSKTLSVKERIALFCQVCSAVQYVHQNLVVHRFEAEQHSGHQRRLGQAARFRHREVIEASRIERPDA